MGYDASPRRRGVNASGQSFQRSSRFTGRGGRGTGLGAPEPVDAPSYGSWRAAQRPDVVSVDPTAPGECLCGDPADYMVSTNWFGGRRSRDPVCDRHLAEVLAAIGKQQARRDGG
jgi:hypothetical protein